MKDTLTHIVKSIVDHPDHVEIVEEESQDGISFVITVAQEDMGKIIGKDGRVIRSIRNVMKIPAIKQGKRINVTLSQIDEQPSEQPATE